MINGPLALQPPLMGAFSQRTHVATTATHLVLS